MRADLSAKTMKQLREIARAEGICLGYDGARKDTAVAAIVSQRRHREYLRERGE
jgi:threonine aldolase